VLLDDCGHMSLMEKPDAVADAVVALIQTGRSRQVHPRQGQLQ
jgi:hypothetical protein